MSYHWNQKTLLTTLLTLTSLSLTPSAAQALSLKVQVQNHGPDGGVHLSPVWAGFHDGSFDSYNGGLRSEPGLELIAEDGNTSLISQDFLNNLTYIDNSSGTPVSDTVPSTQVGTRVDGMIGNNSIAPGETVMRIFDVTPDESNGWFSYVSMVSPSNDYYIANGNPTAWGLMNLFTGEKTSISFNIGLPGTITDAGTEVEDFATSMDNEDAPGLPDGQTGPNQGEDQNGLNINVMNPYGDFLNKPDNFDLDFASLNFNNQDLYPNGIARVTISVFEEEPPANQDPASVPESSTTVGLMAMAGLFFFGGYRRRQHSK